MPLRISPCHPPVSQSRPDSGFDLWKQLGVFWLQQGCWEHDNSMAGWWFQPLWKILVSWVYYSQYMEKSKIFQTTNQMVWWEHRKSHGLTWWDVACYKEDSCKLSLPSLAICHELGPKKILWGEPNRICQIWEQWELKTKTHLGWFTVCVFMFFLYFS